MEAPAAAAYTAEIEAARAAGGARQFERALHHLERAHILGQRSTARHVQAHSVGNSGRARVSAFAPMPVPEDLRRFVSGR
jgi:hypothetical protein